MVSVNKNKKLLALGTVLIIVGLISMSTFQYWIVGFFHLRSLNIHDDDPMMVVGAIGLIVGLLLLLQGIELIFFYERAKTNSMQLPSFANTRGDKT